MGTPDTKRTGAMESFWSLTGTKQVKEGPDSTAGNDNDQTPDDVGTIPPAAVATPTAQTGAGPTTLASAARQYLTDYDSIQGLGAEIFGIDDIVKDLSIHLTLDVAKNIVLYGPEGVGKTEAVNGFIAASRAGATSLDIKKRVFYRLETGKILSDDNNESITSKISDVVKTLSNREYVVLVIDNAWNFFESLQNKGAYSAISALMDGIASRRIQSIMITKDKNISKLLDIHPAFKEIFTPYQIKEKPEPETLHTLRGKRAYYQNRYMITVGDDAIKMIGELSQKYPMSFMPHLAQPGRAVRLLEFLCASYRESVMRKPEDLTSLEHEISSLELECASINGCNPERTAEIQSRLMALREQINPLQAAWTKENEVVDKNLSQKRLIASGLDVKQEELAAEKARTSPDRALIDTLERDISERRRLIDNLNTNLRNLNIGEPTDHPLDVDTVLKLFADYTHISAQSLSDDELSRVINLESELQKRVMGQDHAIKAVSSAIKISAAGMNPPNRPLGCYFFIGPTGVGKSQLAYALDQFVTGVEDSAPITFDMTEFQEKHTVASLLGAPPGYSGSDTGGLLINKMREKRRSVVLFDEIEKAHRDIFDVLIPIMDKARATSRTGEEADFSNSIIIVTSNIGAHYFSDPSLTFDQAQAEARALLRKEIRPEILGRFNDVIFFRPLSTEAQFDIAAKFLTERNKMLEKQKFSIHMAPDDLRRMTQLHYDPAEGGRSLRNVVEGDISMQAAEMINAEKDRARKGAYGSGVKVPPGGEIWVSITPDGSFRSNFKPREQNKAGSTLVL